MTRPHTTKTILGLSVKQWLWLLVLLPGIPFITASLFIIIYSNMPWPTGEDVRTSPIRKDTRELIILIHGKGDNPSSWAEGFAEELETSLLTENQEVATVDWGQYSKDLFRSTLNGRRIGQDIGSRLVRHTNLQRLHLIGHSAGSFVVYGICEAIKKKRNNIFIQTSYLDPVGIYGGIDWGFGTRNFGNCADISDAYIDRDDNVPGSNAALDHPHTFDVTALKAAQGFNGSPHLWPIEFYRRAVLEHRLPYWNPSPETLSEYPPTLSTDLKFNRS